MCIALLRTRIFRQENARFVLRARIAVNSPPWRGGERLGMRDVRRGGLFCTAPCDARHSTHGTQGSLRETLDSIPYEHATHQILLTHVPRRDTLTVWILDISLYGELRGNSHEGITAEPAACSTYEMPLGLAPLTKKRHFHGLEPPCSDSI